MNILIVEDHEPYAKTLCLLITEKMGAECFMASTIEEALDITKITRIDITLLALSLPINKGSKELMPLNEVIASIPLFPPPVIVVTDLKDDDGLIEIECYRNWAQNFITKDGLRDGLGKFKGAELIKEITKSYWRNVLPDQSVKIMHEQAEATSA